MAAARADAGAAAASTTAAPAASLSTCLSIGGSRAPHHYRRHVVLGVDAHRASHAALEWAAQHLFRDGDMFHLVHVLPVPDTLHKWTGVYVPPDDAEEAEEVCRGVGCVFWGGERVRLWCGRRKRHNTTQHKHEKHIKN
jgi:hypothetical protein